MENITKQEQELCIKLLASGVFKMRNGQVTLHFDNDGNVQVVERKQSVRFVSSSVGTSTFVTFAF